jgi:hypothetical protein
MEKVQKTPVSIKEVGQPDQYGNRSYSITFQDQTSGFFRCQNQNLFTEGVESVFYFGKTVGKSGKEYYKIDRVEKHENDYNQGEKKSFLGGSGKDYNKKSVNSEKFMCLSYAKDIFIAFNGKMPSPTEVTAYAEILYSETINGKGDKPPADGHQAALQTPPPVEPDGLPF